MKISDRLSRISELDYLKVARRMRIAAQIDDAMKAKGLSKKDLAVLMNRRPSEITKWLSGNQNFTSDILAELSICQPYHIVSYFPVRYKRIHRKFHRSICC